MRRLFFLLIPVLMFVSCQREIDTLLDDDGSGGGSSSTYFIKARIDGAEKTFNANAKAVRMDMGGFLTVAIVGNASAGSLEGINITINNIPSGNAIGPGTYLETDINEFLMVPVYVITSSVVYGAGLQASPPNPFTISFSELTTTTAKGTFSGDVYENSGFGPAKKTFTNGEFNLKF